MMCKITFAACISAFLLFCFCVGIARSDANAQQAPLTSREQYEQQTIANYHLNTGRLLDENAQLRKERDAALAKIKELEAPKDEKKP